MISTAESQHFHPATDNPNLTPSPGKPMGPCAVRTPSGKLILIHICYILLGELGALELSQEPLISFAIA